MSNAIERLSRLGSYMKECGVDLYYSPFYTYVLARPDSYNARHAECSVRVLATQLVNKDYESIRENFLRNAEYICGFRPDLRSRDAAEFVAEMLFGDFVPDGDATTYSPEIDEVVADGRFRHFNASMVCDIVTYLRFECSEDLTGNVQLLNAMCFLGNPLENWEYGESISEIIDNLYWEDCLKRDD